MIVLERIHNISTSRGAFRAIKKVFEKCLKACLGVTLRSLKLLSHVQNHSKNMYLILRNQLNTRFFTSKHNFMPAKSTLNE